LTSEQVAQNHSATNTVQAITATLNVMNWLKKEIKQIEAGLLAQVKLRSDFQLLSSIDGIGNILALTIMLETGDINRFSKPGNYASYCRCISGARFSNGKKKAVPIVKMATNTWLGLLLQPLILLLDTTKQ
jgi:transposase